MEAFTEKVQPAMLQLTNCLIYLLVISFSLFHIQGITFPALEPRWTLLNFAAAALPLLFLTYLFLSKVTAEKPAQSVVHITLYLLILWISTSSLWAVDRLSFFSNWLNSVSAVVLALFFSYYLQNTKRDLLITFMCLSATFMSVIGLLQYFGFIGPAYFIQDRMPASTFVNKNLATPIISLMLPLMYLQLIFCRSKKRLLFSAICLILCFSYLIAALTKSSILATFIPFMILATAALNSRSIREKFACALSMKRVLFLFGCLAVSSGLIAIHEHGNFPKMFRSFHDEKTFIFILAAISLAVPLFSILLRKLACSVRKDKKQLWVLLAIVAAFLVILLANLEISKEGPGLHPFSISDAGLRGSIATRVPKLLNSLAIIRDHPLLGVGPGGFIAIYPLYHQAITPDPSYNLKFWFGGLHNDPLQVLVELGLIGFAMVLIIGWIFYKRVFVLIKQADPGSFIVYTGLCLGITGLLLDSCMNYPLHEPTSLFYAALCFGMVISASEKNQPPGKTKLPQPNSYFLLAGILIAVIAIVGLVPFSINKYQALSLHMRSHHKPPHSLSTESQLEFQVRNIRQAVEAWPQSAYFMHAASTSSYEIIRKNYSKFRGYSQENYQNAYYYNQKALEARPYEFSLNFIRIWLAMVSGDLDNINKAEQSLPLLLKAAPDESLSDAKKMANNLKKMQAALAWKGSRSKP